MKTDDHEEKKASAAPISNLLCGRAEDTRQAHEKVSSMLTGCHLVYWLTNYICL